MENANPPYHQPQRPFYPIDISNFKQYRDEPIYDAWNRFRNLLRKFPHHSFALASLTRTFYYRVGQYDQMRIEYFANGDFRELSTEEAWDTIEDCAQYYYRVDNPTNVSTSQLNINFQDHETSLFGDEYISVEIPKWLSCNAIVQAEHIGDLDVMEDLAEHDHINQKDQGPMIDDDESQETYDESLGQFVYSSQNIEDDPYDSDIEVEMPKEACEILGKMLGLDYNKTHVEDIGDINTENDEVNNISHKILNHHLRHTHRP